MRKTTNLTIENEEVKSAYMSELFDKHVLISEETETLNDAVLVCYKLANKYGVVIKRGEELADRNVLGYVMGKLGNEYADKSFYRGFPQSVRRLSKEQLLVDQLIHYAMTYGLGNFDDEAGHSVFEEEIKRTALKEKTTPTEFEIVTWDEAYKRLADAVSNILKSTRPLNSSQFQLVKFAYSDVRFADEVFAEIGAKNTAIKLLIDTRDIMFAKDLAVSDILKVVENLWNDDKYFTSSYCREKHTLNKLNLKNTDRKFITEILDSKLANVHPAETIACCERKKHWAGLLHHIHYKAKTQNAVDFVNMMRGGINISALSEIEKCLNNGRVEYAVSTAVRYKGAGYIVRNLNYFLSRCQSDDDVNSVLKVVSEADFNPLVAMQFLINVSTDSVNKGAGRTFTFTKYNRTLIHKETTDEINHRKSFISDDIRVKVAEFLKKYIQEYYGKIYNKVYIDPAMEGVALPIYMSAGENGFGILPTGSRIPLNGSNIRAFTYWSKVNDIDLSTCGIDEDGHTHEFSWRSMWNHQSNAITFSGDVTNGYKGASEYFDIDLDKFAEMYPTTKYLIFNNNVFSGAHFKDVECTAGFMLRKDLDAGQIFEPKTVKTAYKITGDSTFATLFAIDLTSRELIWLNMTNDSNLRVSGDASKAYAKYFDIAKILNYKSFFANIATEIVDNYKDADVIVSDKIFTETEYAEKTIHSYDIDKVIALINTKPANN